MPNSCPIVALLAIDDDVNTLNSIQTALESADLEIHVAADPETGLEVFGKLHPRIVLLNPLIPMAPPNGMMERILNEDPGAEVILITGDSSMESAIEAIQKGARDCLPKPLNLDKLRLRVSGLVAEAKQKEATFHLESQLVEALEFEGMIGRSPLMLDVFARIRRVAPHFQTVLLTGQTGTGKELAAKALHHLHRSGSGPFAVCNCAAVVETLFESELFGHVKGAFTGATEDKVGLFEYATRGTVFLDEIGEMPLPAQAKLLRVIQNWEVQRVGSPVPRKIDVRLIAATNRDLRSLMRGGKFREDLFYRLGMLEIALPSLAERKEDLPLLERYMVEKYATRYKKKVKGITRRAQTKLASYHWPGNVRELENAMSLGVLMTENDVIDLKDLPKSILTGQLEGSRQSDVLASFREVQQRHLKRVMEYVSGDKSRASQILGISRSTLYTLLSKSETDEDHS